MRENKYHFNSKGQHHRIDGPAIECFNGTKSWFLNGQLHRGDGPAVEGVNGYKAWFIENNSIDTIDELLKLMNL